MARAFRFAKHVDQIRNRFLLRVSRRQAMAIIASVLMIPTLLYSQVAKAPAKEEKGVEKKPEPDIEADEYTTKLYIGNADGTNLKPMSVLRDYTSQGSPEWSSDGKLICFDCRKGDAAPTWQIAVVNGNGTDPRILCDGNMPCFSPRGNRIAFSRSGKFQGVWIMSTEGPDTEIVQVDATGFGTSWASDGRLAYTSRGGAGANLIIANIVEGTRDLVFDEETMPYQRIYWNFAWSRDSKRIAFKGTAKNGKEEIGIVDARGESFGLIRRPEFADAHESVTWSADGKRVVIARPCAERGNFNQFYSFNPDNNDPPTLLENQDTKRSCHNPGFSSDGKKMVFSTLKPGVE